jgi:rod shape-determining protein MreC
MNNFGRKRTNRKYIILIVVFLIVFILFTITHIMTKSRKLNTFEKVIKDTSLLVCRIAYTPIKFTSDKIDEQKEKKQLYEKYKVLEKKIKETDSIEAKKQELETEVEKMEKLLELNKSLSNDSYLNATVINRNIGYWYNTITLDKGKNNGVKKDMAVVVSEGLIGKVIKVTNFNCTVKLLTSDDVNNKISVKIQTKDGDIYGLLSGYDRNNHVFTVEGISSNAEIQKNSKVVTTGMGDIFPSGILVGTVKNITTDNFDLAKTVKVKNSADFDDIRYVTLLRRNSEDK